VNEPSEFDAGGATYSVQLPSFEGPLDLLLHLCQKHELNILDIPISFVTEKYLEYLNLLELVNLDIASEYLLMAATLAHIKSKMLLPKVPDGQEDDPLAEEEDPREALIRRLLEYQKYKQAGADLAARGIAGADIFTRGIAMEDALPTGPAPLADVPLFALMDAFARVLEKSKVKITHDIVADRISINDRIHELVEILRGKPRVRFEELFGDAKTRFDLVITFLALLEMAKLRMTRLYQSGPLAEIYIESTSDAATLLADLPPADDGAAARPREPVAAEPADATAETADGTAETADGTAETADGTAETAEEPADVTAETADGTAETAEEPADVTVGEARAEAPATSDTASLEEASTPPFEAREPEDVS
jgi:segregation and condensation protein A